DDTKPYTVSNNSGLKKIGIKIFFADGARHRIDVSKNSCSVSCTSTAFYTEPYYLNISINILGTAFHDSDMLMGWKDSLLIKSEPLAPDARWLVGDKNFFSLHTFRGSFDSTCMIYYNRYNYFGTLYNGAVSLTSPRLTLHSIAI